MRRNPKQKIAQLDLQGVAADNDSWWQCNGIFSPNYLKQHLLRGTEYVPSEEECRTLYYSIRARWLENLPGLRRQSEAYTRTKFLDPTLSDLGWSFIPEQQLPQMSIKKRPDYCLFIDAEREQSVARGTAIEIFQNSATVLEAKKAQHPLDQISKKETPNLFPSQQIQDYLRWAKDNSGRFFDWAILTNGNEWRLYCEQSTQDSYFVFHLAKEDSFCPLEDFRLFVALFRPIAFNRNGSGKCLLDGFRSESLIHQEELEANLRRRIFNVLEELAEGYFHNSENGLTEKDLPEVYDTSLILLYRLLFILYAESRGLLPAKSFGPGSNTSYRENFSLVRFTDKLRNQANYDSDALYNLYEDLLKLFHVINGTRKEQNKALNVTRYNGGLFDPAKHPSIDSWRVGDKALANVLRQLIFAQPPARAGNRQQTISTEETVDFGTLEVRQLGDIYEGLLGGQLALRGQGRLELVDDSGNNHQSGVFYTPDWVVRYLVKETLQPLVDQIDASQQVQAAFNAKSLEKRQDNSFALGMLGLNIVDPAMGSGHFLVRATEWLAEQIVYHPTTRLQTEQVVANGSRQRSRDDILAAGRTPVPPGVSQEQAEIAFWRRRVVESCIYGVDINPLAVELAKLSLWLTCIAVDEPLSFLDHHLHVGNSLIYATPEESYRLPSSSGEDDKQLTVDIGSALTDTLQDVIEANASIEAEASTEIEIVKTKEERWKVVQSKLQKFQNVLDLWITILDDVKIEGNLVNAYDYRALALYEIAPEKLKSDEKAQAEQLYTTLSQMVLDRKAVLNPFHWQLEFPAVFYKSNGTLKEETARGFDAVLGNPPYISTHTSSEEKWRDVLEKRAGYLDDLYVHFTDLGFNLLRPCATFGFIISDTFFTLGTKERMRRKLQDYNLTHLGQCNPFKATVDAAIFVASKEQKKDNDNLLFIQARYGNDRSKPDRELPILPYTSSIQFDSTTEEFDVRHGSQGCLRLHLVPIRIYREALKRAFFEPRPATLKLYSKFNKPIKELCQEWWGRIETSQKFADNLEDIRNYHASLKPGDITLVGLIAEGGQGMRTANNGRFLGYLAGTPQAKEIDKKREVWTHRWLAHPEVGPVFRKLLAENGGDPDRPTGDTAAWEACVEPLKSRFDARRDLGFSRTDLYRIAPNDLIASEKDFEYAWKRRKAELLHHWQTEPQLKGFWSQLSSDTLLDITELRVARDIADDDFCSLCTELQTWVQLENSRRKNASKIPSGLLGLRSNEDYTNPADAPRVATIFNGLSGRGQWVPFRKGDPEGNRWIDDEPLYINWSTGSVEWLSTSPSARWQGYTFFLIPGITWTAVANHVAMKARYQQPCIFDADSMRLTPRKDVLDPLAFLSLLNSNVLSFFKMKFIKHTQKWEIGDLRMLPIVIPTAVQAELLVELAERAMEAKRLTFTQENPPNELVEYTRKLAENLSTGAPAYLRPSAQLRLLTTASDCLSVIELAVNWEAEKLYGVEGIGPFDEF